MGITGNLKTMQLGELFQWLSLGSKTGTLLINGHGIEKRIYFQEGRIASTSSSDQREYLGHFLVSNGFITEDELKMAMEVQEESQILLGKILVMINAIAESDLLRLMRKKAEESIYDVFLWTEGNFEFIDGAMPDQKMVPLSLDVTGIVMEGMRRYDEWQLIRQRVPDSTVIPEIMRPLDMDVLAASVEKTGRMVVVHEASTFLGLGAEVAASVTQRCFYSLEAPVIRVGGYNLPYPPSKLEEEFLPDLDRVLDAVDRSLAH